MFGHFILLLFLVEDILSLTDFLAQPYYCYWLLPFPFHIEKRGKSSKRFVSTLIYRRYTQTYFCVQVGATADRLMLMSVNFQMFDLSWSLTIVQSDL